jgi:hypothetical protein
MTMTQDEYNQSIITGHDTYRKKPVLIHARQFTDEDGGLASELVAWMDEGGVSAWYNPHYVAIEITTLEGTMSAEVGDWIIKGVKGEFYPCKPDIFEMTYEPA